jgi:leucyl/phenylalanyl-tRNA---protein transferase
MTFDCAFEDVMRGCADARPDTWINDDIITLYTALHQRGFAHSVEAWQGKRLVGGLYGLALGGAFFGESMFSTEADASKVALVYLVARLWKREFTLLDTQFINQHLLQFGAYEIPRAEYHRRLAEALAKNVSFGDQSPLGSSSAAGGVSSAGLSAAGWGSSLPGAVSPLAGVPSGAFSDVKSCAFEDVTLFLHSITHTS